jgi:hypothetical protein
MYEQRASSSFNKGTYRQALMDHLPNTLRGFLRKSRMPIDFFRVQTPVSAMLGPQYRRSRDLVEIDLTWSCNLRCYNCNRSCEQAPTGERINIDQIQRFIDESMAADLSWKRIRLLGGEPTLHPQFFKILDLLQTWRDDASPGTLIELVTNGYGSKVNAVLDKLPPHFKVDNSFKKTQAQPFKTFNIAPIDRPEYAYVDYTNGCFVTQGCGIGFTPYGWYQCAVAGGIDRIFGFNMGRKKLPSSEDDMYDQFKTFCRLCGIFKRLYRSAPMNKTKISHIWNEAYAKYRVNPPRLTRY